jgi:tetratricopeptide (TPR) repeat protein
MNLKRMIYLLFTDKRGIDPGKEKEMVTNDFFEDGKRHFVEGRLRDSIEAFTKAVEAGYDPQICYLSRGAAYLKLREVDNAIEDFSRVITLGAGRTRVYYYRGMAHAQKKEYGKAVEDFTRALELKPDDGASLFARGAAYLEMGRTEEAGEDIKHATHYLNAAVQGYADTIGDRTHLDKVLAILEGERRSEALDLNESEFETIKAMMEEAVSSGV